MSYARACLITLVDYLICLAIAIVCCVIFWFVFGSAMLAALHH